MVFWVEASAAAGSEAGAFIRNIFPLLVGEMLRSLRIVQTELKATEAEELTPGTCSLLVGEAFRSLSIMQPELVKGMRRKGSVELEVSEAAVSTPGASL